MGKFGITAALLLFCMGGAMAQGVQGVHPDATPLQVGVGFTFVSFQETPGLTANNAGVNGSVVYYHDFIGAEGQVSDVFGSQNGKTSQLLFAGGGVRFLLPRGRTFQPWVHGLLGYSRLSPKLSFGGDTALGYKLGGGVDINPHRSRIGFRISADMYGSEFFRTYQLSPEVSAGIVLSIGRE